MPSKPPGRVHKQPAVERTSRRAARGLATREQDRRPKGDGPGGSSASLGVAREIDVIIREAGGWRSGMLSRLRALIDGADPDVTEEVKWKKPSKPLGVPVWSHDGILCIGDTLKSSVRLTFPKGALIRDPAKLFNARMDSSTVRAIDFHENDHIDEDALRGVVLEAVRLNTSKARS